MEPHCFGFKLIYDNLTEEEKSSSYTNFIHLLTPNISPLPEDVHLDKDFPESEDVYKYRITLKLFYRKTYNSSKHKKTLITCTNPHCNCSPEDSFDIDKFMNYDQNYISFVENVMDWVQFDEDQDALEYLKDFEYTNGGIISFTLYSKEKLDEAEIIRNIIDQNFEDGMYKDEVGISEGIIPLHKLNGNYEHIELGVIDCRDERCVRVKRI